MVEQALVDVADLLDVEGAVAETTRLGDAAVAEAEDLERVEDREDRSVVDRQWVRLVRPPRLAVASPLEERIPIRIEQAAAVGRQPERLVLDAAVDRPEGCEQPMPAGGPPLEGLLAEAVRLLLELLAQARARRRTRRTAPRGRAAGPAPPRTGGRRAASSP